MAGQTDKRLAVGSWSEGSTRTEDIAEAVLSMVTSIEADARILDDAEWLTRWLNDEEDGQDGQIADEVLDSIIMQLGEYAPIYCYVGGNEHDPADFGVWPSELALAEAIENAQPMPSDDESKINIEDGVIITVNDHGNVTVYAIERGSVLLSLV
jgi:hypothetical protein